MRATPEWTMCEATSFSNSWARRTDIPDTTSSGRPASVNPTVYAHGGWRPSRLTPCTAQPYVATRSSMWLRYSLRVACGGLFGSVARGEDRPDSDIDLLADLPPGMS